MSCYYSEKYVLLVPPRKDVFKVCSEQDIFGAEEFEERARKFTGKGQNSRKVGLYSYA